MAERISRGRRCLGRRRGGAVRRYPYGVRRERRQDWQVERPSRPDRRQRHTPLLVGLVCIATASVLLSVVHAPRELIALVLSQLVGLIVVMTITRFWKISVHSSASGGLVGILVSLYGLWAVLGVLPLALVAWSRTVLDAHTWPQAIVGAASGATVALTVFPLLR